MSLWTAPFLSYCWTNHVIPYTTLRVYSRESTSGVELIGGRLIRWKYFRCYTQDITFVFHTCSRDIIHEHVSQDLTTHFVETFTAVWTVSNPLCFLLSISTVCLGNAHFHGTSLTTMHAIFTTQRFWESVGHHCSWISYMISVEATLLRSGLW